MPVNDFSGQTAAAAVEAARSADLRPAPERVETDDRQTHGLVIDQDPKPGADATRGAIVTLYVGAPPIERPADDFSDLGKDDGAEPAPAGPDADTNVQASTPPFEPTEDVLGLETDPPDTEPIEIALPFAESAAQPGSADARTDGPSRKRRRPLAIAAALLALVFATALLSGHKALPSTRPVLPAPPAGRGHQLAPMRRGRNAGRHRIRRSRGDHHLRKPAPPVVQLAPAFAYPPQAPAPLGAPAYRSPRPFDADEFF